MRGGSREGGGEADGPSKRQRPRVQALPSILQLDSQCNPRQYMRTCSPIPSCTAPSPSAQLLLPASVGSSLMAQGAPRNPLLHSSPHAQLLLPASVGSSLMAQGAPRNGAMLFELSTPGGCITHAGLLEFTAAEGFVALPRKVSEQLLFSLASGGPLPQPRALLLCPER